MVKRGATIGTLNFGSFPGKLMFACGYSFGEVCLELKKQKCKEWLESFKQCEYLDGPEVSGFSSKRYLTIKGKEYTYCIVYLREPFNFSDRHHTILSHELIHICTHHLDKIFDIIKENEGFAYTHSHLLGQCYKLLRDSKKKK